MQVLDLRLQDEYVHVADYTEHEQSIFQNRYQLVRPYEFKDSNQFQITWELHLDLERIDREVYSILEWLGDLGGLNEALRIILGIFIGIINFNKFEHHVVEYLYKQKPDDKHYHSFKTKPKD